MNTKKLGIVAFGYGVPKTIRSNVQIGAIARSEALATRSPVYTQLDVPTRPDIEVEYTQEQPGEPPPTLRIARGAVRWAMRNGLTSLCVVAAKPHMWRAMRDVKMAVKEAGISIEVTPSSGIELYPPESWFCEDSTQSRTTTKKEWDKRERILHVLPFWIYRRVAS